MVLKLLWAQKRMFWAFENSIFQFFGNFWGAKLKLFSEKAKQSLYDHLNSKLIIVNFFKNCFEASLSSKTNFLSLWKRHFSVFSKLFNDKIQTIFWESDAKGQKLFKSKFGLSKPLRKWFWSYLDVKSKCSGPLKITFFSSLQFFEWRS